MYTQYYCYPIEYPYIVPSINIGNVHINARKSPYPETTNIYRTNVPDEKVPWSVYWPEYRPIEYTAPAVTKNPPWADDQDARKVRRYNEFDGKVDRQSSTGIYQIDERTNRPINPFGRTGMCGRGLLGHWGPNHAGDPIITRWSKSKPNVLEVILITRKDTGEKALPGGMVDPGEHVSSTIKREFIEEAMNSSTHGKKYIDRLFQNADIIYKGYVDDPRNTDNAWMETVAVNMHDHTGKLTKHLHLQAGDDAAKVKWIELDRDHKLYASHEKILRNVIRKHRAYEYWSDPINFIR